MRLFRPDGAGVTELPPSAEVPAAEPRFRMQC
jgi:hypothetical protein